MSDATFKIITTERELFDCLIGYMRRAVPMRAYNQGIIDFVEYLIKEVPEGLDHHFLLHDFDVEHSPLAVVFESTGVNPKQFEYSSLMVTFTARLYDEICRDHVCLEQANRMAICLLNRLACRDSNLRLIEEETRGDDRWLISTAFFEGEIRTRVELKQERAYAGYLAMY